MITVSEVPNIAKRIYIIHGEKTLTSMLIGLKPVPGTWETWNMSGLEASSGGDIETGAAAKKMMEAAALNKKGGQSQL